ncbi:hypothetical protein ACFU44_13740 [Nocardia rhizosphaerihabitans]|uniref:hypothetical protein n=1 Tax=Nocardia rhizosphaerihabitans TaxID=1691570 RepID=UPI00366BB2FE
MANFWDEYNTRAQQAAIGGMDQTWDNFFRNKAVTDLAEKRKTANAKPKKDFLTDQISTGGGIGGALAGGAAGAALGSVVPVIGTGIGGLLGAVLGGAAGSAGGEVAENSMTGDALDKNVLQEALLGGATSLPLGAALKLAQAGVKASTGVGKKAAGQLVQEAGEKVVPTADATRTASTAARLDDAATGVASAGSKFNLPNRITDMGNKMMLNQYGTISKPVARATRPVDTIGRLADLGITKPDDAERIAGSVTGSGGIINKAVLQAVDSANGVDVSPVRRVFDEGLQNYGVVDGSAKSLKSVFNAQMSRLSGPRGSLNPLADPTTTLEVMKSIEKRIAELSGKTGRYRIPTQADLDQASVLKLVKDEMEDQIYTGAGANANLRKVLTPELRGQLAELQPNSPQWQRFVDNDVMSAKTIADLRGTMAPFVRASKIIDEGDINSMTFGGRVSNSFASPAGIKGGIMEALSGVASGPVSRGIGNGLRTVGGKLGSVADAAVTTPPTRGNQSVLGLTARQGIGRLPFSGDEASAAPIDELGLAPEDYATLEDQAAREGVQLAAMQPSAGVPQEAAIENPFGVSLDEVAVKMKEALATGDQKNYAALSDIYDRILKFESDSGEGQGKKISVEGQKILNNAQSGMQSLDSLEAMIDQNPDIVSKAALPDVSLLNSLTGTSEYRAAIKNVQDSMSRLRSGASMTEQEAARFDKMLPRLGDSPETIKYKLKQFRDYFGSSIDNASGGAASPLEDLMAAGSLG